MISNIAARSFLLPPQAQVLDGTETKERQMAIQSLARTAAVVVIAAVALAGCGGGQANVSDTNPPAGSPTAVSVPATEGGAAPSGAPGALVTSTAAQPSPATGPAVSVPDISTQLQAVDDLLSGVGRDVQQSDASAGSGE